jgi:hypothetical protein
MVLGSSGPFQNQKGAWLHTAGGSRQSRRISSDEGVSHRRGVSGADEAMLVVRTTAERASPMMDGERSELNAA